VLFSGVRCGGPPFFMLCRIFFSYRRQKEERKLAYNLKNRRFSNVFTKMPLPQKLFYVKII